MHFCENPNFGINNLFFLTPLPHFPPGGGQCASLCSEGINGDRKEPSPCQSLEGIIQKEKKSLSTQRCPEEWKHLQQIFYKEHFDSAHEWFNWNLLLPSFFLPRLELENALKRSSSFGNNRKRSIYIYKYI